jgi:Flp pilus assembly protein TadD
MSLERGRVCASCGARNKPRWEFCVRCGEALADDEPADAVQAPTVVDSIPADIPWRGWLLSALVLGGAVAAYLGLRGPAFSPSPDLFTIGSPAPNPSAVPSPPTPNEGVAGERMLAAGNFGAALPLLAEAVRKQPDDPRLVRLYALALRRAGQVEASVDQLKRVVALSSEDASARLDLARMLDGLGRTDEAAAAYGDLLRVSPRSLEGLGLLAAVHTRQGKHAEALPLLRRYAELKPDDLANRQNLAFALEKTGDEAAAIDQYTSIVADLPTANIARGRLAEAIARRGDSDRAEALYREGIALEPTIPALHRSLGSLLERKGKYEDAAVAYREYARLAPNSSDAKALTDRAEQLLEKKRRASTS